MSQKSLSPRSVSVRQHVKLSEVSPRGSLDADEDVNKLAKQTITAGDVVPATQTNDDSDVVPSKQTNYDSDVVPAKQTNEDDDVAPGLALPRILFSAWHR